MLYMKMLDARWLGRGKAIFPLLSIQLLHPFVIEYCMMGLKAIFSSYQVFVHIKDSKVINFLFRCIPWFGILIVTDTKRVKNIEKSNLFALCKIYVSTEKWFGELRLMLLGCIIGYVDQGL